MLSQVAFFEEDHLVSQDSYQVLKVLSAMKNKGVVHASVTTLGRCARTLYAWPSHIFYYIYVVMRLYHLWTKQYVTCSCTPLSLSHTLHL